MHAAWVVSHNLMAFGRFRPKEFNFNIFRANSLFDVCTLFNEWDMLLINKLMARKQ